MKLKSIEQIKNTTVSCGSRIPTENKTMIMIKAPSNASDVLWIITVIKKTYMPSKTDSVAIIASVSSRPIISGSVKIMAVRAKVPIRPIAKPFIEKWDGISISVISRFRNMLYLIVFG